MRKIAACCGGLVLVGVLAGCGPAARTAGGLWGRVIEVPGLSALVTGRSGGAEVSSVSCGSAGDCAAGGYYWDRGQQGFAVAERNGRWGTAIPVPGLAALNGWRYADVMSVSCAPAGGCAAGGFYAEDPHGVMGFAVSQGNGAWGKAAYFPAGDYYGEVDSISCVSDGNCLAGGETNDYYFYDPGSQQGFLAGGRNGRWGKAGGVPGLTILNAGNDADVLSVSCVSAGNCAAGGYYGDLGDHQQGFTVAERKGRWGTAIPVPGLAALNTGGNAQVSSVSCATPGNCAAGGYYQGSDGLRAFAAVERDGRWGTAIPVPGLAALNKDGGQTQVLTISCAPAGSCAAGGFYTGRHHREQGFVATEDNGTWDTPIPLPGLAALSKGGSAQVTSLSCPSPGTCAAAGTYTDRSGHRHGFVTQPR